LTIIKRVSILAVSLWLVHSLAPAQSSVREYRRAHEHEILREFMELLAIPNVADDRENIRRNAAAIMRVQFTSPEAIVRLPTAGGSLPLSVITDNLSTVTMTVPIANSTTTNTPRTKTCGCKIFGTALRRWPRS
jgi:hypothetical protein